VGNAINSSGQIAGTSDFYPYAPALLPTRHRAVLYTDSAPINLGTGGTEASCGNWNASEAWGINDAGQVVGQTSYGACQVLPFIYAGGTRTPLGTTDGVAYDINNTGAVVGEYLFDPSSNHRQAFLYNDTLQQLVGLSGTVSSVAYAINDSGTVVGWASLTGGALHAVSWNNRLPQDLGVLGTGSYSEAKAINSSGFIVGWSEIAPSSARYAFIYEDGHMVDLNDKVPGSGWTLSEATGINDAGQIVGIGQGPNGATAFIMSPDIPTPTPSPIPSNCTAVSWMNAVNVAITGNTLRKTGPTGWNGGGVSTASIQSGDGYVEATVSSASDILMFGLSHGDTDQTYPDIDFAFYIHPADSRLYVYEGGANRGPVSGYVPGDVLRVAVAGGVVKYYRNGTRVYVSSVAPVYPLLLDSALYNVGSQLANALICNIPPVPPLVGCQPVAWNDAVNVAVTGNTLRKTGPTGWNAGGSSTTSILSGDGYVEATVSASTDIVMFGLSHGDTDQTYPDIDFAFYVHPADARLYVYEGGANRGPVSDYVAGDVLRVAVTGGVVKYYRNGNLVYTSTQAPVYPLLLDSSLYNVGAQLLNARISDGSPCTP
jgi:probable HAF family extracellular repeat protein